MFDSSEVVINDDDDDDPSSPPRVILPKDDYRTVHAAKILGISIRTLRNKLKLYNEDGLDVVPPSGGGDHGRAPATA